MAGGERAVQRETLKAFGLSLGRFPTPGSAPIADQEYALPIWKSFSAGLGKPVRTERTTMTIITRRAALGGFATLGATGAAAHAATLKVVSGENDFRDAAQLRQNLDAAVTALSTLLADFYGGQFKAEVYPANHPRFPARLALHDCTGIESAESRMARHLIAAHDASAELQGFRSWKAGGYEFAAQPGRVVLATRVAS